HDASPRRATAADADALQALAREAYAHYVPVIGREPQPMAADWRSLLDEQEIWIIDGSDGTAEASLALEIEPAHIIIWSVAVSLQRQHQGIGRRLMAFAEARARTLGRSEIRLFTNALMVRNIALYRGLGYIETRQERLPDRVIVHMTKAL